MSYNRMSQESRAAMAQAAVTGTSPEELRPFVRLEELLQNLRQFLHRPENWQSRISHTADRPRQGLIEIAKNNLISLASVQEHVAALYEQWGYAVKQEGQILDVRDNTHSYWISMQESDTSFSIFVGESLGARMEEHFDEAFRHR